MNNYFDQFCSMQNILVLENHAICVLLNKGAVQLKNETISIVDKYSNRKNVQLNV